MTGTARTATLSADPETLLGRGKQMVRPALEEAVYELHPELAAVAAYHLGWLSADGTRSSSNGGKAIRPVLAILSAQSAGGDPREALGEAVAVELVHNFSILHDDVMDGDRRRRHRATAWSVFGAGRAVLAGDALLVLAGQVVGSSRSGRRTEVPHHLNRAVGQLILGQAEDLSFERRTHIRLTEYLEMAGHKTAALMACSLSIGALGAGAEPPVCGKLSRVGWHLGMAFQAVDDLLGIWGTEAVTGKPVFGDLERRKKTLPVVAALNAGRPESAELHDLFSAGPLSAQQAGRAARLIEQAGGRQRAVGEAHHRLEMALEILQDVPMPESTRAELTSLARYLVVREA